MEDRNNIPETDICSLMEEVTIGIAGWAEEKGIKLSFSCPLNICHILNDPAIFYEVIQVLLRNMVELSDANAIIKISVIPGDFFIVIELLNKISISQQDQLHCFFADTEDVYQKSLYHVSELAISKLQGEISYGSAPSTGTYLRLKMKVGA